VRLAGWLLFDVQHAGEVRGRLGNRLSAWEIHPVTSIALWDPGSGGFVELPR
jgi:hypothetical protein